MDDRDLVERAQIRRLVQETRDTYALEAKTANFLKREKFQGLVDVLDWLLAKIDERPAGLAL